MATLNFNATEVDPAAPFEALPAGTYTAIVTESEMKPTKSGAGRYLQLTLQVTEGEHRGRLLWARLNLENPSDAAVRIARAELSALCRAVGVMAPKDSLELHNIPLKVRVARKNREDTGEVTNEIKGYEHVSGVHSPQPAAAVTAGSTPPWQR